VSSTTIVVIVLVLVGIVLVGARVSKADELPRFAKTDAANEPRIVAFVKSFLKADAQARQLLNRSNQTLYATGYRPVVGVPHDPENGGRKLPDLQAYFAKKLALDLRSVQPLDAPHFQAFIGQVGFSGDETVMCAGDIAAKYNLNVAGKFRFDEEVAKVPAGPERERIKQCWLNDAILGSELRMLAWIYSELFGHTYATPDSRGAA
jgi:hypothetical protein